MDSGSKLRESRVSSQRTVKDENSMDLAVIKVSQGKTAARVWMKFEVSQGSQSTVRALLSTQSPIERSNSWFSM